jgi:3-phenylpropionate/cinnamic acid dioxygenase small subunit
MTKLVTLLGLLVLCAPAQSQNADALRQLVDRAAIEEVMQKYVWSVDSLDADGYVSVFTEDAEIHTNGTILKGHAKIRTVVTDMQTRQAKNRAEGKPVGALHHVISNERISFQSPTEATYQSYWQTMRKGEDNRYTAGGFGTSEDRLVKLDGKWLIKSRKLVVFTD